MVVVVIAIVGVLVAIPAIYWTGRQLVTAGKGSFLKERNAELADAVDQMGKQIDRDRAECDRRIALQDAKILKLEGRLEALTREWARELAAAMKDNGWTPPKEAA